MRVAVVGAGINGVMTAWELARQGCNVTVYERHAVMGATSGASTKLLHGGLRYLEHGYLGLVRESLRERRWWLEHAPTELVAPLRFVIPVYKGMSRPAIQIRVGLWLYDVLAGSEAVGRHAKLDPGTASRRVPGLRRNALRLAYEYTDVQMDDERLGKWAALQARQAGVKIVDHSAVTRVSCDGDVELDGEVYHFDRVINATGPWAQFLLEASGVESGYSLRWVRGSHLVVSGLLPNAVLMQVHEDKRVVFAIPWKGRTLLGTTEVEQGSPEPEGASDSETSYLISIWNRYFERQLSRQDIVESFSGVRPLVAEGGAATSNTREHALERKGKLVSIFGGKWTTARLQGQMAAALALKD